MSALLGRRLATDPFWAHQGIRTHWTGTIGGHRPPLQHPFESFRTPSKIGGLEMVSDNLVKNDSRILGSALWFARSSRSRRLKKGTLHGLVTRSFAGSVLCKSRVIRIFFEFVLTKPRFERLT